MGSKLVNYQLPEGSDQEKVLSALLGRAILYPLLSKIGKVDGYQCWMVLDRPAGTGKSKIITALRSWAFNENRVSVCVAPTGRSNTHPCMGLRSVETRRAEERFPFQVC